MLFTKRIKYVRDLNQEMDFLSKKSDREISKLNDDIVSQVKKMLRKFSPGIQVRISKLSKEDFTKKQKRTVPIAVFLESVNGKKVHRNGFWVEEIVQDDVFMGFIKTENILTVEQLENVCYELSENLGLNICFLKFNEKVIY